MLFYPSDAWAQSPSNREAAEGQMEIKPLEIGDPMYDVELKNTINYGTGMRPSKLSDFNGQLLILDFWATWCAPCVSLLPKMDSLQREYRGKMSFLSVTSEKESTVRSFLERQARVRGSMSNLTFMVEDNLLKRMFPHATIPHYVWIDAYGKVVAITGHEEINGENIARAVSGELPVMKRKTEAVAPFDPRAPLFFDERNVRGAPLIVNRTLTGYIGGIGGGYVQTIGIDDDDNEWVGGNPYRRISVRNRSVAQLYQVAYTDGYKYFKWHNTVINVRQPDSLQLFAKGEELVDWMRAGYGYCYELIVHKERADEAWDIMKADLKRFFPQYSAHVEKKAIPSLCLVRTSSADSIRSEGGGRILDIGPFGGRINGYSISHLLRELEDKGLKTYGKPIVNLTGYQSPIDIEISADLGDLASINKALESYHLQFVEQDHEIDMLVIADSHPQ